jgi:tetratricopeptide (TPR) repeat protein
MHDRKGYLLFCLFCTMGFFALSSCCIGLFQFLTQNRVAMAQPYKSAGQSYFETSLREDVSSDARAYLLSAARENMLNALALDHDDAGAWALSSRIFYALGEMSLSKKAMDVALALDPAQENISQGLLAARSGWQPVFVLSRYEGAVAPLVK